MRKHFSKSLLAAVAVAAVLAGCGGGYTAPSVPQVAKPFMGTTVQALLDYMNQLMAQTDETSEPQPVDNTPLPMDDTA